MFKVIKASQFFILLELKFGDANLYQGLFQKILMTSETPAGIKPLLYVPDDLSLSPATHTIKAGLGG